MTRLRRYSTLMTVIAAALLLIPARAQEAVDGRGVVKVGGGSTNSESWLALVLPRLFDIDPASGALLDAGESDRALVRVMPANLPSDEVTLSLSETRTWNDGEPVTAYDILFSLMVFSESPDNPYYAGLQEIAGVRVIDEQTLTLRFAATEAEIASLPPDEQPLTATCDDLPRTNTFIVSPNRLTPSFREFVEQFASRDESPSLAEWRAAYRDARMPPLRDAVSVRTGGAYVALDDAAEPNTRLVPADGAGAALISIAGAGSVDALIAGETNVLLDVPIAQRAGLRALADANARRFQIAEVPGRVSLVVLLNLGDPSRPLPGFHPETGEPLRQGQHPILSNVKVRQALQLAIDSDGIIDGILQQSAVPLAGVFAPGSWAFDSTLLPHETNVEAAKRLLDEAGWIDRGGVVRRCLGCQTARDGTELYLDLGSSDSHYEIADALAQQWWRIGVGAYVVGADFGGLAGQTFDAFLLAVGGKPYEDADPDRTLMLTPAGDLLNLNAAPQDALMNYGSYSNPQVTALLEQARTVPGCGVAERADIYHEIERLLQQDLPFLPVAAPNEFYAAAPNVLGFAPRTGDPLWNVESWVVSP